MTDPAVLIAGAGPTGLAAALFLSRRGIAARVVDQAAEPSPYSRAFGVNARTLALLEPTGVTERLLAQGWRLAAVNLWRGRRRILRVDFSGVRHRFPFMLIHSQARTEAALTDALAAYGVVVERGVALESVGSGRAGGPDHVRAGLRHEDGRAEDVTASALLGADGARSAVRKALGMGFPGASYEEPWRLYDLALDTPLAADEAHAFLVDGGAAFAVRLEGHVWRLLGNVPDLPGRLPAGTRPGRVVWESDFGISHRLADRLQAGRVCLAGDAAHIHSGLGARGMNLGIEDAHVFAALLAGGRLAEYEALRRPVVRRVMRTVERLTAVPRGRSVPARAIRALAPLLGPLAGPLLAPLAAVRLGPWILGLDHPVPFAPPA